MSAGVQIERHVLKNAGALALARGVTTILNLVTFAYLARVLEPERFGILGIGLALVAYFGLPVDFGLNVLGIREIARNPRRSDDLVGSILGFRLLLVSVALGCYAVLIGVLDQPAMYKLVLGIQGLALVGQAISLEWAYQGIEEMGVVALRNVIVATISLAGMLLLVRSPDDVAAAAAVSVFAVVAANGSLLVTYARRFGTLRFRLRPSAWMPLIRPALPLWASQFMVILFVHLDTLLVGFLRGESEAGLYTAVYKLSVMAFIPADILLMAFLPALAHAYGTPALMRDRSYTFVMALFSLGFPLCLGGILLANDLTVLVYGTGYSMAAPALALLMGNILFAYGTMAFGQPLVAWDRERAFLFAFAVGLTLNVPLDLLLIPRYGIEGAAASTTAAQALSMGVLLVFHYRVTKQAYLGLILRIGLACVIGVGGPLAIGSALNWPVPVQIISSVAAYGIVAYVFRLIDFNLLLGALRHRTPSRPT